MRYWADILNTCLYVMYFSDAHIRAQSTAARRRLMRDFRRLQNDPPCGVTGAPLDNNIMVWQVRHITL